MNKFASKPSILGPLLLRHTHKPYPGSKLNHHDSGRETQLVTRNCPDPTYVHSPTSSICVYGVEGLMPNGFPKERSFYQLWLGIPIGEQEHHTTSIHQSTRSIKFFRTAQSQRPFFLPSLALTKDLVETGGSSVGYAPSSPQIGTRDFRFPGRSSVVPSLNQPSEFSIWRRTLSRNSTAFLAIYIYIYSFG